MQTPQQINPSFNIFGGSQAPKLNTSAGFDMRQMQQQQQPVQRMQQPQNTQQNQGMQFSSTPVDQAPLQIPSPMGGGQQPIQGNAFTPQKQGQDQNAWMQENLPKDLFSNPKNYVESPEQKDKAFKKQQLVDEATQVAQKALRRQYMDEEDIENIYSQLLGSGLSSDLPKEVAVGLAIESDSSLVPKKGRFQKIGYEVGDFLNKVAESATQRGGSIAETFKEGVAQNTGRSSLIQGAKAAGQIAGFIGDVVGEGVMSGLQVADTLVTGGFIKREVNDKFDKFIETEKGQEAMLKLSDGVGGYQDWATQNPETADFLGAMFNVGELAVDIAGGSVAKTGIKTAAGATIDTGKKIGKAVKSVDVPSAGSIGESLVDKTAEYFTNTAQPQDKLFKAQSPTLNVLNKKRDFKTLRKQSDRANELVVKEGFVPKDTETRRIAHESTMKSIWGKIEERIGEKATLQVDQSALANTIDAFVENAQRQGLAANASDIKALKLEAQQMRRQGIISLPDLEVKKQYINNLMSFGGQDIGDVYKNGMRQITKQIGDFENAILSKIPNDFGELKRDFGSLKGTYEDILKSDLKAQKRKSESIIETYSRLEGLGDIVGGALSVFSKGGSGVIDVVKGAGKVFLGKSLAKATDSDFLIQKGFADLARSLGKKVDDIEGGIGSSFGPKGPYKGPSASDIVYQAKYNPQQTIKELSDLGENRTIIKDSIKKIQNGTFGEADAEDIVEVLYLGQRPVIEKIVKKARNSKKAEPKNPVKNNELQEKKQSLIDEVDKIIRTEGKNPGFSGMMKKKQKQIAEIDKQIAGEPTQNIFDESPTSEELLDMEQANKGIQKQVDAQEAIENNKPTRAEFKAYRTRVLLNRNITKDMLKRNEKELFELREKYLTGGMDMTKASQKASDYIIMKELILSKKNPTQNIFNKNPTPAAPFDSGPINRGIQKQVDANK